MTQTVAIEARIRGRVQGVAFRAWTQAQAEKLGLTGWVTNNPDGSVSAFFVGPKGPVDEMVSLILFKCGSGKSISIVFYQENTRQGPNGGYIKSFVKLTF